MSEEDKAKPAKGVMGNLPATRPTRMARRRDGEPVSGKKDGAPARASAKARPKAAPKTASKPTRATPKATGKPATPAKPKSATARSTGAAQKPRAVRSGSPSLAAAKKKSEKARGPRRKPAPEPPKGAELVTTAVQATGELAKIGLTLGGQAIKRAARRLPKP
jgi:hypothetical protein